MILMSCSFTADMAGTECEHISRMKSYLPSPNEASINSRNSSYASTESQVSAVRPRQFTDHPFSDSRQRASPFVDRSQSMHPSASVARIFGTNVNAGMPRSIGRYPWPEGRKYDES